MRKQVIGIFSLLLLQGCVATRNWVSERISPLEGRLSGAEQQVDRMGNRLSSAEGRLGQVDAKTEQALARLAHLRLERRLVLDLREGATFAFNSAALAEETRREIDGFLSDLKGDVGVDEGAVFLIAGHTDSTGSEDYNYELGRRRADAVARYLIAGKKLDPTRVVTVSYGKSAPLADNSTKEGRSRNRRVEILVYREDISTAPTQMGSPAGGPNIGRSEEQASAR